MEMPVSRGHSRKTDVGEDGRRIGLELACKAPQAESFFVAGGYLLVVRRDLTVERRPVATGNGVDRETIIASGIQAGERLITSGQEHVTPGKASLRLSNSISLWPNPL